MLPAVAGVLALHRLTVRAADLRWRPRAAPDGGIGGTGSRAAADWRVAAEYGSLPQAARLRADLVRALDGSLDIAGPARRAGGRLPPRRRGVPGRRRRGSPSRRGGSRLATVLEVRAQDAPGLLHRIGRALEGAGVRVRSAHVSTLGANAVDAFYVTGPGRRAAARRRRRRPSWPVTLRGELARR